MEDLYWSSVVKKASSIIRDEYHPAHCLIFEILKSIHILHSYPIELKLRMIILDIDLHYRYEQDF